MEFSINGASDWHGEQGDTRHDDVLKWEHFLHYWPFVWGIHRSPLNSTHKGQWRGALMFCLICIWINGWVNNSEAGDLRCHCTHYDVIIMVRLCYTPVYLMPLLWKYWSHFLPKSMQSCYDGSSSNKWKSPAMCHKDNWRMGNSTLYYTCLKWVVILYTMLQEHPRDTPFY